MAGRRTARDKQNEPEHRVEDLASTFSRVKIAKAGDRSPWSDSRRPKEKTFSERKDAVLTAAARLFCEKGYESGSFDELAERINVSKPTIYYYVGSKEQCFYEITRRGQAPILEAIARSEKVEGTALDKLVSLLLAYAEAITTDYGRCIVMVGRSPLSGKLRTEIEDRISGADRRIMALLQQGMAEGTIKTLDPVVAFHSTFGALNWSVCWYKLGGRLSPRELAQEQVRFLLEGLRA